MGAALREGAPRAHTAVAGRSIKAVERDEGLSRGLQGVDNDTVGPKEEDAPQKASL